jgi:hypothetical protein
MLGIDSIEMGGEARQIQPVNIPIDSKIEYRVHIQ